MDDLRMALDVLSRWLHVGTVVVLVGGAVFVRFVLTPAASELGEETHERLRGLVMGRWRKVVAVGIGLLLLSGLYNYIIVTTPAHKGDSLYHALLGTKILLALGVFFLASALTGRAEGLKGIRDQSKTWSLVLILLAAVIICISGFLKIRGLPG